VGCQWFDLDHWLHLFQLQRLQSVENEDCSIASQDEVLYSMVRYGTVWYSMVQYGIVWYSMVQYGIVWYSMVQYGTVWYSMV